MFSAIRASFAVIAVLCSANVLFHIKSLAPLRRLGGKHRLAPYLAALPFAILNLVFMLDVLSTAWMALMHLTFVLIGIDAISLIIRLFGKETRFRCIWLKLVRGGLAFVLSALIILYGLINIGIIRKTEYSLKNESVPGSLVIGMISDTHLGTAMDADGFEETVDRALSDGAQMLILAGDLVDESTTEEQFEKMCAVLSEKRAPKGIYYVFGNHDGSRYGGALSREEIETAFTDAGVTVLTDESVLLDGWLRVAGRRDANERDRMAPDALLSDADRENEFIVLIDPQPVEISACAASGADLLLSGHTHNGQVWPVGWLSEVLKINELEYGHARIGEMDAIVSSGAAGWGFAFRTSGRSEYVLINIHQ